MNEIAKGCRKKVLAGFCRFKVFLCLGLFFGFSHASAQSGESYEEVFDLSPFSVLAEDQGYLASQTTVGTRLRADTRDLAAQIEFITTELIDDFGITNTDDAFVYSGNVENQAEFIPSIDGGSQAFSSRTSGRIRGLDAPLNTSRDLFGSITRSEVYNVNRIEIASGAQSLLFGLGVPTGVVNTTLKQAIIGRDFTDLRLSLDTDNSFRTVVDINKSLIDDKFGLRIIGLRKNDKQHIKPNYDKNDRLYITSTMRLFPRTTLRLHGEWTSEKSNRPVSHLPWDFVTPYQQAIDEGRQPALVGFGAVQDSLLYFYGGNESGVDYSHWRAFRALESPGRLDLDPERYGVGVKDPNSGIARQTFSPEYMENDPLLSQLIGKNLLGNLTQNKVNSRIFNLFIEQRIADFHFEIAGHYEEWERRFDSLINYNNFGLYLDVNEFAPRVGAPMWQPNQAVPVEEDDFYMVNPNFGKMFVRSATNGNWNIENTKELRFTGSYNLDLRSIANFMGTHDLTVYAGARRTESKSQSNTLRVMNVEDDPPFVTERLAVAQRVVNWLHYFDEENTVADLPPLGDNLDDLVGNGFDLPRQDLESLRLRMWNADGANGRPTGNQSTVYTGMAAWQGKFFNNRLITTAGVRRDELSIQQLDNILAAEGGQNQNPQTFEWAYIDSVGFDRQSEANFTGNSFTTGVVFHPLDWLSVFYQQADTFNIPTGQLTPFGGDELRGQFGDSKDYGLRMGFLDGQLEMRLNFYEAQVKNNTVPGFGFLTINALRMEKSYKSVIDDVEAEGGPSYDELIQSQGLTGRSADAETQLLAPDYPIIGDSVARGFEFSSAARLGNWDLRVTFAKNEATAENAGESWLNWIENRRPFWESLVDVDGNTWSDIPYQGPDSVLFIVRDPDPRLLSMEEFYNTVITGDILKTATINGKPTDTSRKWRANVVLSHTFNDGRLSGLRVGAAYRFRSAPIIGFPILEIPPGPGERFPFVTVDLDNPHKGDVIHDIDAFLRYGGRGLFGKDVRYSVAFRVHNLLTSSRSYRVGRVNHLNEPIFTVLERPRYYSLELSLSF